MKLHEYKQLPEKKQFDVLWQEGVLIDSIMQGKNRKLLYAIHNFYVELWCDLLTCKINWKLSFKQGKLLDKYLEKHDAGCSKVFNLLQN